MSSAVRRSARVSAILTALAEFRRSHRCGDGGSTPPELPNPIDDFYAKFVGARYVNDRGTAQEKTVTAGVEALLTATPEGDPFLTPSGLRFLHQYRQLQPTRDRQPQ